MILEGIVTTRCSDGSINIAPMGPRLSGPLDHESTFELKPFKSARTYANLVGHPEGVLHVTDDVLLLARAAVGPVEPPPPLMPAVCVQGRILQEACRAYEFRVAALADQQERVTFYCEVVRVHRLRDFFGFNRAMHSVLEAAILATRTSFLPAEQIESEYERLAVIVAKTGGPREQEAFDFLRQYVRRAFGGE
jgi:hypothetical protein